MCQALTNYNFCTNFSSEYLQANNHDSLRVLALHDLGNLHFYNGNTRLEEKYFNPHSVHACMLKQTYVCAFTYNNTTKVGLFAFNSSVSSPGLHTHTGAKL